MSQCARLLGDPITTAGRPGRRTSTTKNEGIKHMKLLTTLASASLLAFATLLAAAQAPSTLRIGLQEDPDMLDPHKARTLKAASSSRAQRTSCSTSRRN